MRKPILFAIVAIVFVAGCSGQPLTWNLGSGETNIDTADMIVASNEPTIPSNPAADTDFVSRFTVKNVHETKRAQDVGVWIYDTGKCDIFKIGGLEAEEVGGLWPGLSIETAAGVQHTSEFAPGQQELVKLDVHAPSSAEIVGLPYTCPIRYLVNYSFAAASSVTIDVMDENRLKQIETQTGERPVYARTLNIGPGPIRIFMEPISTLPVEAERTLRLEITVKNEGTGEFANVQPGELIMKLPKEFEPILDAENKLCGGFFEGAGEENNIASYSNFRKIDLIEKQANPITCEFKTQSVSVEKEYTITAELPYSYGYFGQEISVPITPD